MGGKLALQKCTWVLINLARSNRVASMESYQVAEGITPPGARLMLVQSKTGEEVEISRLDPGEAYRTLGAWISADGIQRQQL